MIKGCKFSSTGRSTFTWTGPADDQGRPDGVGELVDDATGVVSAGWAEHGTRRGEWVARDTGWTFCITCGAAGCADIDKIRNNEKVPPPLSSTRAACSPAAARTPVRPAARAAPGPP